MSPVWDRVPKLELSWAPATASEGDEIIRAPVSRRLARPLVVVKASGGGAPQVIVPLSEGYWAAFSLPPTYRTPAQVFCAGGRGTSVVFLTVR